MPPAWQCWLDLIVYEIPRLRAFVVCAFNVYLKLSLVSAAASGLRLLYVQINFRPIRGLPDLLWAFLDR